MFDQLTESNRSEHEVKNRRGYFVITALLVGVLFLSGVVWSLYGKDLVLGGDMELSVVVMPVAPPENAPRPPEPKPERHQTVDPDAQVTTRQTNMLRVDEVQLVPTTISVTPNTSLARTDNFKISPGIEKNAGVAGLIPGTGTGRTGDEKDMGGIKDTGQNDDTKVVAPPPPAAKKRDVILSKGVINGKATNLPMPTYPPTAIALRLNGIVNVEVLIDESGRVVSARAVSGPVLLRQPAERAARNARFTPTLLSDEPVKVTGIIAYNFNRN